MPRVPPSLLLSGNDAKEQEGWWRRDNEQKPVTRDPHVFTSVRSTARRLCRRDEPLFKRGSRMDSLPRQQGGDWYKHATTSHLLVDVNVYKIKSVDYLVS